MDRETIKAKLPWLTEFIEIITITDPAKDPDDENTMVLMGNFTIQGAVQLLAVVANLAPSAVRADLTEATLNLLGLNHVPVGEGTDCKEKNVFDPNDYQWQAPYLSLAGRNPDSQIKNGQILLVEQFEKAKEKSITLLLISGMTDAATFMQNHIDLFLSKINEVVIMGGVKREDNSVILNEQGLMEPDSAANNAFDMPSAEYLYIRLQKMNIPMWILTREAAYAAPFPRSIYDEMAATGHPVGIRLRDMQCASIENLWKRANMPADNSARQLPPRCDKEWFCKVFLNGQGHDRKGTDSIWDLVQSFQLYDPLTMIAALPRYRNIWFKPYWVNVLGTEHAIIGLSSKIHGIKYPEALRGFVHSQIIEALDIFAQAIALSA